MTTAVSDGVRSLFASERDVPFYRLGTTTNKRITDYRQMMKVAGIEDVRYSLTPAILPPGADRFVSGTNHVLWTNPLSGAVEVIGTVGDRYRLLQPNDVFGVFGDLRHPWEVMGVIDKGRGMFGAISWEREISLDPNGADEKIKSSLVVKAANDGGGSVIGGRQNMRFTCFNMFRAYFRGLSDKFTVRHTESAQARLALVKAELRKTDTYFDLTEKVSKEMFATPLPDAEFWKIVEAEYAIRPDENKRGALTRHENKMGLISEAWKAAPNAAIRGTVYGGMQALLEFNQWGRLTQNGRSGSSVVAGLTEGQENFWAAGAGFDNQTDKFRGDLFRRFYSLVPNQSVKV